MPRRATSPPDMPGFLARFGARGRALSTLRDVALHQLAGDRYVAGPSSAGFARPDLSVPAYAGWVPQDGLAPIYHYFDRTSGGRAYTGRVTRSLCVDHRGGRLTYDEHDGTDLVCPAGTIVVAAAPGVLVATRDRFLRGGLTACVDHGGVVTQYTHLARVTAEIGQPLERGEALGVSGHGGFDMMIGFPWVPPHVHFMAWVMGVPVDPFLRPGEDEGAAAWASRNDPQAAAGPLAGDPRPPSLRDIEVDAGAIEAAVRLCKDAEIAAEVEAAASDAGRAAILEDSLHHDRHAWPEEAYRLDVRPGGARDRVRLTLPLSASEYRGARPADAPWTRPR